MRKIIYLRKFLALIVDFKLQWQKNGPPAFAIYFSSNVVVAFIPFALLPILTRAFTTSEYGIIGMFGALLAFLYAITGLKSESILSIKYFSTKKEIFKKFLVSSLYLLLCSGLIIAVAAIIFSNQIEQVTFLKPQFIFLGIITAIANVFITIRLNLWMVKKQPYQYAAFHCSLALVNIALSLSLVFILQLGFSGRIFGISGALIVFGMVALWSLNQQDYIELSFPKTEFKETFRYAYPLVFHALSYTLLATIDRYFISQTLGLDSLGIYVVAIQLSSVMMMLIDSISKSFVPIVFEAINSNDFSQKKRVVRLTYRYCIFYIFTALILTVLAPTLIHIMAGPRYEGAIQPFIILVYAHLLYGFYEMFVHYLFFKQRTITISAITVFVASISVMLIIVLMPIYGLVGASLAFLISAIVRFIIVFLLSIRTVKMPWLKSISD